MYIWTLFRIKSAVLVKLTQCFFPANSEWVGFMKIMYILIMFLYK